MTESILYKTVIYCRLSLDDGSLEKSGSIQTQKMMLEKYCRDNNFTIKEVYIDDGYLGLNFERSDFQRLMQDIKLEKIGVVITKDLSRLGRDYIKIGLTGLITEVASVPLMFLVTFLIIIILPILLLIIFIGINNLEWYYIYNDHIEARNLYGIKNTVFYDNVSFIEEVKINLTTRGMKKEFYIFNDGRKNNNNIFDNNSCYNTKKLNFRIYKTKELEKYIVNILKFNINVE